MTKMGTISLCGCFSKRKRQMKTMASADEKLRSFGGKHHHAKTGSNLSVASSSSSHVDIPIFTDVRTPPPDVAPPPLPPPANDNRQQNQRECQDELTHVESSPLKTQAPPIQPKSRLTNMAERRIQRQGRKEEGGGTAMTTGQPGESRPAAKRRSRSEGPHGRRRQRSSMHEGSKSSQHGQSKHVSSGRYSMFAAEPQANDDAEEENGLRKNSESESLDSDDSGHRQWTKNPLLVRKTKRSERSNRTENRKSLTSNGVSHESNPSQRGGRESIRGMDRDRDIDRDRDQAPALPGPRTRGPPVMQNRGGQLQGFGGPKSKYQQLEERRKKRVDLAVTSDEECSPQSRISRLRQRAMLSTNLYNNTGSADDINTPKMSGPQEVQNNGCTPNSFPLEITPMASNLRKSMYDEADNRSSVGSHLSAQFYDNYTKQQGVAKTGLSQHDSEKQRSGVISGRLIPVRTIEGEHNVKRSVGNGDVRPTAVPIKSPEISVRKVNVLQSSAPQQPPSSSSGRTRRVIAPNASPQMRSFQEVKSNQAPQLKKAVERIKLNQGSPNSSSEDSLDELIESNIQYLESEIESGKLKRQSGSFSGVLPGTQSNQRRNVREIPASSGSAHEEIKFRLQGPSPAVNQQPPALSRSKDAPRVAQRTYASPSSVQHETAHNAVTRDQRGNYSNTLSPYMNRRSADLADMEDLSKSDSQLSSPMMRHDPPPRKYSEGQNFAPYPVLNQHTGNIMYVQPSPHPLQPQQGPSGMSLSLPSVDAGMFSDVDYDIEVSERIKKWEKKFNDDADGPQSVLNTIPENETFSDSGIMDTRGSRMYTSQPIYQHDSRTSGQSMLSPQSGVSQLSVTLAKSTSSISDSRPTRPAQQSYGGPHVISSETDHHRIFGVVQSTPVNQGMVPFTPTSPTAQNQTQLSLSSEPVHHGRQRPYYGEDFGMRDDRQAQSMSNVTLSESDINSMQQSWPPMVVDSDSGIRKHWRMSRFEDELSELKEIVSDNFRDLKKRFDSDHSETDVRRSTSPTNTIPHYVKERWDRGPPVSLSVEAPSTPKPVSPIPIRHQYNNVNQHQQQNQQPQQPQQQQQQQFKQQHSPLLSPVATTPSSKSDVKGSQNITVDPQGAEVWSPNMTSRKGLVSMERVKARTLQTIPFSEDPVWKEIEGMTPGQLLQADSGKTMDFSDIEALLEFATSETAAIKSNYSSNAQSEHVTAPSSAEITSSNPMEFSCLKKGPAFPHRRARILSDSSISGTISKSFTTPPIMPLKLNLSQQSNHGSQSASALDEVLEDIRNSLQKKPASPKLMRNIDTSGSNSSASLSLQSPLTKQPKPFVFPKQAPPQTMAKPSQPLPPYPASIPPQVVPTTSIANVAAKPQNVGVDPSQHQKLAAALNLPYIDPEFTQFPYIINGNYHLDPSLLTEKLQGTGLVVESSDERAANHRKQYPQWSDVPANQRALNIARQNPPANQTSANASSQYDQSTPGTKELDQSVTELRELAKEVELKLSQIKSRIVTADEDRLDTILMALRKFAPMTEQRYFDVRFTPIETDKVKKGKLEDALTELEKMYESLELDDKELMDRAERRGDNAPRTTTHTTSTSVPSTSQPAVNVNVRLSGKRESTRKYNNEKNEQVAEVERQTQNEFEDITKSFQVLLDEVTKQCRNVARSASNYTSSTPPIILTSRSSQPPLLETRQEPPRSQIRVENVSQRSVQDSYNSAIKGLENVAQGTPAGQQASSSSIYLNINKSNKKLIEAPTTNAPRRITSPPNTPILRPRNLEITLQSKAVGLNQNPPAIVTIATSPSNTGLTVTQSSKGQPVRSSVTAIDPKAPAPAPPPKRYITRRPDQEGKPAKGAGRFRRRNLEHRKSMPAITRSIETQTVETQTEPSSPPEAEPEEVQKPTDDNKNDEESSQTQDMSEESGVEGRGPPIKRKLSRGIAKLVDLFSSSEDERGRDSQLRHSHSAPDLIALFNEKGQGQNKKAPKLADKVQKVESGKHKVGTPRSIKHRHEAKYRFRSLHKEDIDLDKMEDFCGGSSVTSEDGISSPHTNKPPVYPMKGQQKLDSPFKFDKRQKFVFDAKDFLKAVTDSEKDHFVSTKILSLSRDPDTASGLLRKRTRSVCSDNEDTDRPRSFHELVAAFEDDPKRLTKIKQFGLRKCASADSMVTDLVLQKTYFPEPELRRRHSGSEIARTGSALTLSMEVKLSNEHLDKAT